MANILIVDDSGVVRLNLIKILSNAGYNAFEAANIRAVKHLSFTNENLSLNDIDIIFLDIYLKNESGFELLEYLADNHPGIFVIMLTGEAKKNTVQKAIDLGAKDYIIKPFNKETILDKVEQVLSLKGISNDDKNEKTKVQKENLFNDSIVKEIDRTIRTNNPFSILNISFSSLENEDILNNFIKEVDIELREIDQIFPKSENEIKLILPVTNKEGTEIVSKKIQDIAENIDESLIESISIKNYTFPDDYFDEDINLEYDKNKEYMKKIIDKL